MEWLARNFIGGRLAAALLRLLYHVFPMVDWGFVFVDDFCWLLRKSLAEPLMCHPLFLVTCGCPLSWKKTALLQAKNSTVLLVHCIGQQTAALSQNHSFKPSGNGNRQSSHQDDQTNFSGGLLTIASSRKTTITSPHMLHRAHGGVLAMQVLQILKLRKKAGLVIYPSLRRTRSGGSITR